MTGSAAASFPTSCSGPGLIWLVLFFVVPDVLHGAAVARARGRSRPGFAFTWNWSNYSDALTALQRRSSCARSSTRASATVIALLIAYPLAYAIAFRAGRWKNALLFAVVAPVLHHLPDPDASPGRRSSPTRARSSTSCRPSASSPTTGACWRPRRAVIAGLTYNFLPFMILPIYASLERIDEQPDRGGQGPLRVRAAGLPAGDAAAVRARGRRRDAADLHPGVRRLHQRAVPRRHRTAR